MKLEISLFKFDYKSDYLPYYTKNFVKIKNEKTLLDILNSINNENEFAYRNSENFNVAVNGIFTNVTISLNELVENFGKDLTIEPISIRRAHTDLLINDADFKERLSILSNFTDDEDIQRYKTYKLYFYASNTMNFEYDYIGDPILLLASELIEKDKTQEKDILEALSQYDCGAEYHTSLENRVHNFDSSIEEKINVIKIKLNLSKDLKEQNFALVKKSNIDFGTFNDNKEIKHDFSDFKIAYYKGVKEDSQTSKLLSKLNAKIIETQTMSCDLALDSFHVNSNFTIKLASTLMLDAFDNSADLLIVDNDKTFELFDSNRKALQDECGRDILLPVVHKNELAKLALGLHDEVKQSLALHAIDPELI
jgi:heterodisulfide reductase subunit B